MVKGTAPTAAQLARLLSPRKMLLRQHPYTQLPLLTEFLVINPTLLIHSNLTGPLSNLVVTKLPTSIFLSEGRNLSEHLPLC